MPRPKLSLPPLSFRRKRRHRLVLSLVLSLAGNGGVFWLLLAFQENRGFVPLLRTGEEAFILHQGAIPNQAARQSPHNVVEVRMPEMPPHRELQRQTRRSGETATSELKGKVHLYEQGNDASDPVPFQETRSDEEPRHQKPPPRTERTFEPVPDNDRMPVAATASNAAVAATGGAGASARPQGVTRRAKPMDGLVPRYPGYSRMHGQEGEVVVTAHIDSHGRCLSARVGSSSGFPLLDQAALDTVLQAAFQPAVLDGESTAADETFIIEFRLY